jgi:riboflavin kinase/FMN adenylyltransferase
VKVFELNYPNGEFPSMPCGLVLGNFDGVHRGHLALVKELKRLNKTRKQPLPLGALCFAEHPSVFFGKPVPMLCNNDEKIELFRKAGLQFVIFCSFAQLKDLSPEDFVIKILLKTCQCRLAVCGFNYSFGKKGAGTPEDLVRWLGSQPDHAVSVVPPVTDSGASVSSTTIRDMLERGHPEDATRLLGRPFTLTGKVQGGKQVGREMNTPTANLRFPANSVIPAHGVYAVTAKVGRRSYFGISNVGVRPTFTDDGEHVTCETYLFDFNGDLYNKHITISFLHFLRAERAFPSKEALAAQIQKDVDRAKEYLMK